MARICPMCARQLWEVTQSVKEYTPSNWLLEMRKQFFELDKRVEHDGLVIWKLMGTCNRAARMWKVIQERRLLGRMKG